MDINKPVSAEETNIINWEPLSLYQLSMAIDEIFSLMHNSRPEFNALLKLQYYAGTRVNELFEPSRWVIENNKVVHIQPQKGNALRVVNFADIDIENADEFRAVMVDMERLPKRQYERAFASSVTAIHLWRIYDDGYMHPSTHLLRHHRIKQLAAQGYTKDYIATWIGEKNPDNLDYYLNSLFYR